MILHLRKCVSFRWVYYAIGVIRCQQLFSKNFRQ
nr:MAG TPA: hypothetical protein [Caudoviricetes sp.]